MPAMPFGARIMHKDIFKAVGHLREDFGLYSHEDIEFSERVIRWANKNGFKYLTMLDVISQHIGDEGVKEYVGFDPHEYWRFKRDEVGKPEKIAKLKECEKLGFPFYSPYA